MKNLKEIKDFTDVTEFVDDYGNVFKKDNRARTSLNKTLETNYKAVYRRKEEYSKQWKEGSIDADTETFYVVTNGNSLLKFWNSEWFGISRLQLSSCK